MRPVREGMPSLRRALKLLINRGLERSLRGNLRGNASPMPSRSPRISAFGGDEMYPAAHPWPSRMHESRWTSRRMRVVKYHPGVMALADIRTSGCAASQHEDRSERGGSHHLGDTLSRDPLKRTNSASWPCTVALRASAWRKNSSPTSIPSEKREKQVSTLPALASFRHHTFS